MESRTAAIFESVSEKDKERQYQTLEHTDFTADADHEQHEEEERIPQPGETHCGDGFRVSDEGKRGPGGDDITNFFPGYVSQIAEDGEDSNTADHS